MADANSPESVKEIVIADDDRSARATVESAISSNACNVHTAANGEEALSIIQRDSTRRITLLITDFQMPKMNGLELVNEVRRNRPDIYIILVSANVGTSDFSQELSETCPEPPDVLLAKPLTVQALRTAVESHSQ